MKANLFSLRRATETQTAEKDNAGCDKKVSEHTRSIAASSVRGCVPAECPCWSTGAMEEGAMEPMAEDGLV